MNIVASEYLPFAYNSRCLFLKTLPALKEEVLRWEEKFKNLGTVTDLKEKVTALKHEMAWAFVAEKEKVSRQLSSLV